MNSHLRNQLIKATFRGKGVISFYHMNSHLFKQQYHSVGAEVYSD